MQVQSLGQEDPLEEGVTTRYSILAWGIPWTKEPGLWSMESARVYARSLSFLAQPWGSLCWQKPVKTLNVLNLEILSPLL